MENYKLEIRLALTIFLVAIIIGGFLGYKKAQNDRYVVMGMNNEYLFDSWEKKILYKSPHGIYDLKGIE